jgi:hypothetical protein
VIANGEANQTGFMFAPVLVMVERSNQEKEKESEEQEETQMLTAMAHTL